MSDTVQLGDLGQIALTVSDLARSKTFYGEVLGIPFLFDAGTMAFFRCGSVRLMLGSGEGKVSNGGTILYFRVPDIHAAHAALQDGGVVFTQEPHLVAKMPGHDLWMAFLEDPDGNPVGLMCEMQG